jgi:hypothetical protein
MRPLSTKEIPKVIDAKFIQECLAVQELLQEGNEVINVEEEHLRGAEGNTGTQLTRLRLTYKFEQEDLPKTLVLKRSDTATLKGPSHRDFAVERLIVYSAGLSDVNMLLRECLFYNKYCQVISEPCGIKIPNIYLTAVEGVSNIFTQSLFVMFKRKERVRGAIIMEDLSSGRNLDPVEVSSEEFVMRLCDEMGRMYGYTAKALVDNNGTLGPGLKPPTVISYKMLMMTGSISTLVKRRWTPNSNIVHQVYTAWGSTDYKLLEEDPEVLEALLALQKYFVPNVYGLHKTLTKYPCILQGDFHAGNFMMMPDGKVKMYDMQMWGTGHPAEEICYFLASNVAPTPENDELALRRVHLAMETANQGTIKYDYENFKRDVDICTLHFLAANIVRRAFFDTPDAVQAQIAKLGDFIEGIQRVCRVREQRLLLRLKTIWKRDSTFQLARTKVIELK